MNHNMRQMLPKDCYVILIMNVVHTRRLSGLNLMGTYQRD